MSEELIKQDINFFEYPLWFQDQISEKKDGYVWEGRNYAYRAGYKAPVKTDMIFLMYILLISQKNDWSERLELSRYEIIKSCGLYPDKYPRLEDSLNRWLSVTVHFEGSFYNGKTYESLNFGIIDDWGLNKETKKLEIVLNEKWLLYVKNSMFFKFIDFDKIKQFRSPLIHRLYEILIKSFNGRSEWQIDALKLAEKIPMKEKYASNISIRIKSALKRINEVMALNIEVESVKKSRGNILFVFRKQLSLKSEEPIKSKSILKGEPTKSISEIANILKSFNISQNQIKIIMKNYPEDQIIRNIELTKLKATNDEVRNVPGFLIVAIKNDYAKNYKPFDQKTQDLLDEAKKCWTKNKGSCGAIWPDYQNDQSRACHFCLKFKNQRTNE